MTDLSSRVVIARDLTLDAAAARRGPLRNTSPAQLKKLLDSRTERDVLEGLRKVISMTYRAQPTLPYFPAVIKNIASPSLEVKKLVYIYLLHHAEQAPEEALLSINTIQKALSDQNPQVRALALRIMSGIRVPVIHQIVSIGIKRGCADMSPYVRKAAAFAIPKCYRLEPSTLPQLLEYLGVLLGDKQYYVAGAAVSAFMEVCPDRIDLIHPHYRSLIRKLVDMDEWGQLATLRMMTVYARRCFPQQTRRVKKEGTMGFYGDEGTDSGEEVGEEVSMLDPDLELLLKAARPLLQSRNSAVVVAVARCYLYLAPSSPYFSLAVGPLVSLLRSAQDIQQIALYNIVQVCLARPEAFVAYTTHFLIRALDPPQVWRLKLEVLTLVFPHCGRETKGLILSELEHFSKGHGNDALVRESVRSIGRCAQSSDARTASRCLRLLLKQITSANSNLVAEALEVIRLLIMRDPAAHAQTVIRLAKNLDTVTSPQARASIIWLVGEFAGVEPDNSIAADVLRILAKGFADESEAAKLQIMLLAAKVYVHHLNLTQPTRSSHPSPPEPEAASHSPVADEDHGDGGFRASSTTPPPPSSPPPLPSKDHPVPILYRYILLLARYDTSYDLRDRTRLCRALLAVPTSTELASLLLLAPKPVPQQPSPSERRRGFVLGSASLVVGDEGGVGGLKGYDDLPGWVRAGEEPEKRLRDERDSRSRGMDGGGVGGAERVVPAGERLDRADKGRTGADVLGVGLGGTASVKEKTLDDWLDEDEGGGEEDKDEESEEGSTEEEDDTEEESSGEEEEEEEEEEDMSESEDDEGNGERDRLVK
ncbi:hypothetical protein B0A49_10541 [Cryomyces minteri]|uniref:Clathrin/coatomer adaptor adaptin-like N-terminal domain-containing protein n=1 Tax=Cryomyces minteri TaxID=331657 RepID=A0A4U0WI05_9PEZI|nr:hypothetical protein B0A49_10541 [Cryomyces minteri]